MLDLELIAGPLRWIVFAATLAAVLVVILRPRRLVLTVSITAVGFGVGWVLAWLLSDVWDVIGVQFSTPTRLWIAAFAAVLGAAVASIVHTKWWRKALAVAAVVLALVSGALGINADIGQFPTVGVALGVDPYAPLAELMATSADSQVGIVGRVDIPATTSGFAHRQALVYVPPAGLRAKPKVLPVIEMMSGQPGSPEDVFTAGRLAQILDRFAASHDGEAPIVVVPDQLGKAESNPMCVDSPLGRSATYLTVDVPAWIRTHFAVPAAPAGWTIGGFSQGGTCSIQLGAAHPELFSTIIDVSGEIEPKNGDRQQTVDGGFGGSETAYNAAAPAAVLAANAPYGDLAAVFGAGSADTRYLSWAKTLDQDAAAAGVRTSLEVSPGTAHDWYTVRHVFGRALPVVWARSGIR